MIPFAYTEPCSPYEREVGMFQRILVPLDRSPLAECVLPQAIALSRYLNSQFILFYGLSAR
jgi:hypothetical protein